MTDYKYAWKLVIARALGAYAAQKGLQGIDIAPDTVVAENPPKPELGDIGYPLFPFAKTFRAAPAQLAAAVQALVAADPAAQGLGTAKAEGPYLNIRLDRVRVAAEILAAASQEGWGRASNLAGQKVMVEFSCPNTNKPLHLGHLRNNVLGESLSRILAAAGAEVRKIDLINDRGVHICKSMLAYMAYGGGRGPEDEGLKSDHFVGKYYVMFNQLKAEDPQADEKAQDLLRRWEAGEPEVIALWKKMNAWAVDGIKATYARQGISFDEFQYESLTYMKGRDEVLGGLERGVFYREEDGSVQVNLEDVGLDRKVLLRKDGTSIYITQDIGTAIFRHHTWPFDRLVYVVASEQAYHFKVLFEVLARLGHAWAKNLHHLSYGLVNLPSGRMKTREGTVVDADDLIDELSALAKAEIEAKGREGAVDKAGDIAERIALGALHYYLLQTAPVKDMLYDPEQSLSFTGDTGPYAQYSGARASSIIRKAEAGEGNALRGALKPELLTGDAEWAVLKRIAALPEAVAQAARTYEPSVMAAYLHDIAQDFSTWYRDNTVLTNDDPDLSASRLALVRAVRSTLETACGLVCVPFLEVM